MPTSCSIRWACRARMNVGQIFETHLGWASRGLGRQIQEMLEGMHERGKDVAGKDVKAIRAKLKDIYGDGYAKDIDARDDDAVMELASNLTAGVPMGTPVFDGAREPDVTRDAGEGRARHVGPGHPVRRPHRRAVRSQGDRGLHLHAEAPPPRGRQDPRALDRPVQPRHPAAAGRQGAVRRTALRRNGGVGAAGLRRGLHASGNADGQVGRRDRPHQGLRGDRQGRRHVRGRHSGELQRARQGNAQRSASTSSSTASRIPTRSRPPSPPNNRTGSNHPSPAREGSGAKK